MLKLHCKYQVDAGGINKSAYKELFPVFDYLNGFGHAEHFLKPLVRQVHLVFKRGDIVDTSREASEKIASSLPPEEESSDSSEWEGAGAQRPLQFIDINVKRIQKRSILKRDKRQ